MQFDSLIVGNKKPSSSAFIDIAETGHILAQTPHPQHSVLLNGTLFIIYPYLILHFSTMTKTFVGLLTVFRLLDNNQYQHPYQPLPNSDSLYLSKKPGCLFCCLFPRIHKRIAFQNLKRTLSHGKNLLSHNRHETSS